MSTHVIGLCPSPLRRRGARSRRAVSRFRVHFLFSSFFSHGRTCAAVDDLVFLPFWRCRKRKGVALRIGLTQMLFFFPFLFSPSFLPIRRTDRCRSDFLFSLSFASALPERSHTILEHRDFWCFPLLPSPPTTTTSFFFPPFAPSRSKSRYGPRPFFSFSLLGSGGICSVAVLFFSPQSVRAASRTPVAFWGFFWGGVFSVLR